MGVKVNSLPAFDPAALQNLKHLARQQGEPGSAAQQAALRGAAEQFEAFFLQMVLKSMRAATPKNTLFDSEQTRMFQQMADQQLALDMAQGKGVGLSDTIFRQLGGKPAKAPRGEDSGIQVINGRSYFPLDNTASAYSLTAKTAAPAINSSAAAAKTAPTAAATATASAAPAALNQILRNAHDNIVQGGKKLASQVQGLSGVVRNFAREAWPHAVQASEKTGIPAQFILAHAALETGWGRAVLRSGSGNKASSFNLFNIKTGGNWKGNSVALPVTEYVNGRAQTENARFRAYGSMAESFHDYVRLLTGSPRYAAVLGQTDARAFGRALQDAGYATDPKYGQKLTSIINSNVMKVALSAVPKR